MSSENLEIVHEGWLTKSPPAKRVLKAVSVKLKWRRRWFVLRHSGELPGQYFLAYYTDKSRRKMKGRIDLDQCEQVDAGLRFEDRKSKYHYMFDIKTPKRTYYLAAESEEDMNKWVDFVCHVCGLKPFTVDENADFECPSVNNICRPFPLSVEEHDEEHSSPDSPTSTSSSHYIPISECISGKPLLPILPRSTIEESYDLPRRIRPPPHLSESPPPSPGSESVFTDDESINGSTLSRPSVNWQTFPRLSQNSPDLPVAANRRFTKILPEGCLTAPPRPPKPSHLIETSTKTDKLVEPLTGDETYDFPRSHQMTPPQAQPRTHRRHCYTNAAPGQVSGNIFTYDFVEDCGPKVEEGKTVELESPSFINSPSATANVSSASLEQTPPAVNRQLKPGRKFSDTSAELSPLTPLANPPIVNRRLKPTQIKKNQDSFFDTTSTLRLCPPPMGSLSRQKSRIGPNVVPTSFEPRIHRRHSASDDRLASDKVSSYQINKISSNSRYLAEASRFNDIQYLDLEFESCDKQYAVGNRTTAKATAKKKSCNVGSQFTLVMHDYSMIDGAYPYKTVDFLKTAALSMTRKRAEQERRFGRQNMEPDTKWVSNLTLYHELLDVNNDGVVSIEDLKELTERFSKLNDMTDEQSLLFSRVIENLWYKHWGCIDPFDYVTVEKYLKYIQYVKQNDDGLKDEVVQLLPYLFKTVDKDQNGDISKEEYIKFLECIGTSKKADLIKSLGIVNDKNETIKLEDLILVIKKHLFHNKYKGQDQDATINNGNVSYKYN